MCAFTKFASKLSLIFVFLLILFGTATEKGKAQNQPTDFVLNEYSNPVSSSLEYADGFSDSWETHVVTTTVISNSIYLNTDFEEPDVTATEVPLDSSEYIPMPLLQGAFEKSNKPEGRYVTYDIATGMVTYNEESLLSADISQYTLGHPGIAPVSEPNQLLNFSSLTPITNPEDWPWVANVKVFMDMPNGSHYVCSGTLIDPMHVLTAGHCVYYPPSGGWATSIRVVPGYHNGFAPYGDAHSSELHSWDGWVNDGDHNYDQGVIDLDRPIGGLTGSYGYGYSDACSFYTDNEFHNPGYPAASPYNGKYMYYWYGTFDGSMCDSDVWYGSQVWFNSRAYGGQSGSGAHFILGNTNRIVLAVLSNGNSIYTNAVRVTSDRFSNIGSFIDTDTPSTYDLWAMDVKSPTNGQPGGQLSSLSYVVHNYSSASWSGTVPVNVYLSTDDLITTSDTLIQSHAFSASFDPKGSVIINVTSPPTIPAGTMPGIYYIGVILGASDYNTSNNDSSGQEAAYIFVENVKDTLAPTNPTSVNPNCTASNNTWQNTCSDPSFTWSGAADSGSGVAGYYYYWGIDPSGTSSSYTTSTAYNPSAVPSPSTYYLRVQTRDNAGNTSNWTTLFTFRYDAAAPSNPAVTSSSHSLSTWSADNTIDVSWSGAADGSGSGVQGYSIEWSTSGATLPDATQDTTGANATSAPLAEGNHWYFHIRTRDAAGNWNPSATHYGPFFIDGTAPTNPAVTSSSHSLSTWSADHTIDVSWSGATDGSGSGVQGYSIEWSTSGSTLPDATQDTTGASSTSAPLAEGNHWYFHIRTRDVAGNWTVGAAHYGPFAIDTTPPSGGVLVNNEALYTNVPTVTLTISATDGGSGIDQMQIFEGLVEYPWEPYTNEKVITLRAEDGSKDVGVRFTDKLNWLSGDKTASIFLDTVAPNSQVNNLPPNSAPVFTVSWAGSDNDPASGIGGYDVQCRVGESGDWLDWLTGTTDTSGTFNPAELSVPSGADTYYFRVRAKDRAGNIETYPSTPDTWTTVASFSIYLPITIR